MIEIRLLKAATTVAEERNVTRAAERLRLTQPALTKQLQDLEDRIGYPLFERNSQRFEITVAGEHFLEHALKALSEIELAVHTGRSVHHGSNSNLCIAKSAYVDPYYPSVIRTIRLPLYPDLRVQFATHLSTDALSLLRSGGADVALTTGLSGHAGISMLKLSEDSFYVLFKRASDLYRKRELTFSDLNGKSLVLPERHVNPPIYDRLYQLLHDESIHPPGIEHVHQAEEAAALVLQCGSVALLTKTGAWRVCDEGLSIRPLRENRLTLNTYLSVWLEEDSRLIADFMKAAARRFTPKFTQQKLALAG